MRLLIDLAEFSGSVEIDHWRDTTTVAELLEEAGAPERGEQETLYLDDQAITPESVLSDLVLLEGSRIAEVPAEAPEPAVDWTAGLSDGPSSGTVVPVPRHRAMIFGRSPQADIVLPTESASWEHFRVQRTGEGLKISDAGSTNGTIVSGQKVGEEGLEITQTTAVQAGGAVVLLRPALAEDMAPRPGSLHNLTPARTAPFNRPPRPGAPKKPEPVKVPVHKDIPQANKFSWATIAAPLIMGIAMIFVLGNPRYALFALLSPVMAVGMWAEQKHRRKKNVREEEERFSKALEEFRQNILGAGAQEAARRREIIPDPSEVLRRPALPTTTLWQRRDSAADFMALYVGTGDVPWAPELDTSGGPSKLAEEVKEVLEETRLPEVPVMADLTDAGVIGIVGERQGALALARNLLVQATVHAGPADLTVGVFFDQGREDEWSWTSWLPHTRQAGSSTGHRWISNNRDNSSSMIRSLRQNIDSFLTPAVMVVIDSEVLTEGRDAPARSILGYGRSLAASALRNEERRHRVPGIVLARSEDQLPASCNYIVHVEEDAAATMVEPGERLTVEDMVLSGITVEAAQRAAMNMARFEDPELVIPGATLPPLVRLPELMGLSHPTADSIVQEWSRQNGVGTEVGVGDNGSFSLDLVKDGPHGLVGGTTGSGKSEFLRTLVAGLAAHNDPTRLNFILIDFKGGAAFKACERLPHTIGTISNLEEQLADRALRSLEAEMERRQRIFAAAGEGIDNLPAYLATQPAEPMPRLLLVIDEFAMLAKDFPEVLSSLVSVAAVGRTLGVHMILATQRPAGVVNDDILANTNLRVALRVQSKEDSSNVIGVPDAASISRSQMGRAYVKLGQDEITPVQTALVTGRTEETEEASLGLRPTNEFGVPAPRATPVRRADEDTNDLDVLIDAVEAAHRQKGEYTPRKVWPEALGAKVPLHGFEDGSGATILEDAPAVGAVEGTRVQVALADEPDLQRQVPAGWDLSQGNLLLIGTPGSGTTTTMATIALTMARAQSPEELEFLVLDMGSRGLEPVKALPHTVSYVGTGVGGKEKQARFLRHLMQEIQRRRAHPGQHATTVVLLDGFATLKDEFNDYDGTDLLGYLYRAYGEGPSLGLYFVVSTTRAKAIPSAMEEVSLQRWVFQLADTYDYSALGVKGTNVPAQVPGRCVDAGVLSQMQVATPDGSLHQAVETVTAQWPGSAPKADVIGQLPSLVLGSTLDQRPSFSGTPWKLPIGIREHDLQEALLEFYDGEHALVTGPARSGKSTLLLAIAESVRNLDSGAAQAPKVWAICSRRSPLADAAFERVAASPEEVPSLLAALRLERGQILLLVDDAERFDDADQSMAGLLAQDRPGLCIIAAGRNSDLRTMYSHWTKTLRKSRNGVALQPNPDFDGEFFGGSIPRKAPVALTRGRGYAFSGGDMTLVQTIAPEGTEAS